MRRRQSWLWVSFCLMATAAATAAADEFVLRIPGSRQGPSSAVSEGGRLTIADAAGGQFVYQRHAAVDSDTPAGRFLGYYCKQADQYLLWPASGSGAMLIGTPAADGKIAWRKSRMQIRRTTPGPAEAAPPRVPKPVGPAHVAVLARSGAGVPLVVVRINAVGRLDFHKNTKAGWQYSQSRLAGPLVPGAPLALVADPQGGNPAVYTFSPRGDLVEIAGAGRVRTITQAPTQAFLPGSNLALLADDAGARAYAVDEHGRPWQLDLAAGRHTMVDSQPGRFAAGCPLAAVGGRRKHLFAVDVHGILTHYSQDPAAPGSWSPPETVAKGFVSGGGVAAALLPASATVWVAAVDFTGMPRTFRDSGTGWDSRSMRGVTLPPGCPLTFAATKPSLTAVCADGSWIELIGTGSPPAKRPVVAGFSLGTPVVATPSGTTLVGVDVTGRIVLSTFTKNSWQPAVLAPPRRFVPRFPQLLSRTMHHKPPLPAVAVTLENSHTEGLLLRIADVRQPGNQIKVSIPPGDTLAHRFDRDAGAELVEVYLVPGPDGGMVREERRWPIPPRRIYSVAVYADRVTSRYVDRRPPSAKPPGALPDSETRSAVSLGVFPIPPGKSLAPNARLDVYREAKAQNNPGAAAWFGIPGRGR